MSKAKIKFLPPMLLTFVLVTTLLFGASAVPKVVLAAETPDISAENPVVEQPPRTPPTKCGVYAFMSQSLLHAGYMVLGSGTVNQQGDRWVLFQQVKGGDPLLWVILIYLNAPYQGLDIGSACEIMVGIAWVREDQAE